MAATATTAILNVLFVGALSQVWGLINGLSLFVHLPLNGIIVPKQVSAILS